MGLNIITIMEMISFHILFQEEEHMKNE